MNNKAEPTTDNQDNGNAATSIAIPDSFLSVSVLCQFCDGDQNFLLCYPLKSVQNQARIAQLDRATAF